MARRNKAPITREQEWLCLGRIGVHGGPIWASVSPRASYRSFGLNNGSAASVCLSLSLLPVVSEQKRRKGSVLTRGRFQFCCRFTARESVGVELLEKHPETCHARSGTRTPLPFMSVSRILGLLPESSDALYLYWNHPPFINLFRSYPAHGIFSHKNY